MNCLAASVLCANVSRLLSNAFHIISERSRLEVAHYIALNCYPMSHVLYKKTTNDLGLSFRAFGLAGLTIQY